MAPVFQQVLKGKNKELITSFSKCNWDLIYAWAEAEREKKKNLPAEARSSMRPLPAATPKSLSALHRRPAR